MRKRPLLWFACVFLSGLAYGRYSWIALPCVPMCFIGIEIYYGAKYKTIYKAAGRSIILLSAFLLGMTHIQKEEAFRETYMSVLESRDVEVADDENRQMTDAESLQEGPREVVLWGEITKIEYTDYGVRMILTDCYIRLNEKNMPCNDVVVYASSTHFHVGEIHKIKGKLNLFEEARNQGSFDSRVFYQSQKLDFSVWLETNELLGMNENRLRDFVFSLKEGLRQVFIECMDESASGFFAGMLLGDKSELDKEIKDLFTLGGISHVLAISGLHVSIIGRGFYKVLRKCGVGFLSAGIVAGCLLLLYGCLVGNGMSAVRAIGMMLIFFLGQSLGRSYDMLNALGAMVIFLLWENPFLLEYSGFWFSVMALIGVGFVGEVFSKALKGIGMSLGITLTTLPVVAYCYYEIPLYSPLVNSIVLPMLAPIFILALCGGIVGLWLPVLAKIVLLPCSWGLGFYIWLCEFVERLPFASVICGQPKTGVIVVYYVVLACGVMLLQRKTKELDERKGSMLEKKRDNIICQLYRCQKMFMKKVDFHVFEIGVICLLLIIYPKSKPFEITFLDVGQGDGIYISTGDDVTYFIDGGSTSVDGVGEYRILPFLKSKGIAFIDYWFVSHTDEDHISGLLEVMESGYDVKHLVLSKYIPRDENLDKLLTAASKCEVDVIYMVAGEYIQTESTRIECLYPWMASTVDRNDASMVLEFAIYSKETDGFLGMRLLQEKESEIIYKAFLAGDISSEVEESLLDRGAVDDVWLYKASHHGSKYSNSSELLEILCPEASVISCSKGNLYGHPHKETIERIETVGSELFYTMENGQVSFKE